MGRGVSTITGRRSRTNAGFVLVSVMWVLAIMTVIAVGFSRRSMMERRMAWYALDHAQALQMARGAAELGILEIANKGILDEYGGYSRLGSYTGLNQRWARPFELLKEGRYYPSASGDEFKNDVCVFRIIDCESRISINDAPREMLEEVRNLPKGVIDELIKRREPDEDGRAKQMYWSAEVVRHMPGVTDTDWFGDGREPGLRNILTAWGDPQGLININTAPEAVLRCIPKVDRGVIEAIIEYRRGPDRILGTPDDGYFVNLHTDLLDKLDVGADRLENLEHYCKTTSSFFTIEAFATRRQGKIFARCTAVIVWQGGERVVLQWREDTFDA